MSNIFRGLGMVYFQVPDEIVSTGLLSKLPGKALSIYLLILATAQRKSSPIVRLTSAEITEACDINKNHVTPSVKKLAALGLISFLHRKGAGWFYEFELLDPGTRLPIPPASEKELSLGTLTRKQVHSYFMYRLLPDFSHPTDDGFVARCPFHSSHKLKPTLSVKVAGGGGVWKCHDTDCERHDGGSMLDFEMAFQHLRGRRINSTSAWERITFIIRSQERKEMLDDRALTGVSIDAAADEDAEESFTTNEETFYTLVGNDVL